MSLAIRRARPGEAGFVLCLVRELAGGPALTALAQGRR
jgi:hypothetical protein